MPFNTATSLISTLIRTTNGIQSTPLSDKPVELLQLYDIENCPYCRLVREALERESGSRLAVCPGSIFAGVIERPVRS